jgi:hypothetical protein
MRLITIPVQARIMPSLITEEEWSTLQNITEDTLVEMAADLSLLIPPEIDRRTLCEECINGIVRRARKEGLPFSKYDQEDLELLSQVHRDAIARLQGLRPGASVSKIIKTGAKVYKLYLNNRPDNPVAMMVPTLLPAIARRASEILAEDHQV